MFTDDLEPFQIKAATDWKQTSILVGCRAYLDSLIDDPDASKESKERLQCEPATDST
jgi:hypothetical protein